MAAALLNLEKYAEAETTARQGMRLAAKNVLIRDTLGNALFGRDKYEEAAAAYREAIELEPGESLYYANLARALVRKGKRDRRPTASPAPESS